MEPAFKTTSPLDYHYKGKPILEFVSAPVNPVPVGSILHTFLENITLSYRRIPGMVLLDPSPNRTSRPTPKVSSSKNYRKTICQNLKTNFRNAKPIVNSHINTPLPQSPLKAKLVKYKKSPPRYVEIYRKRLETRKNLQMNVFNEIVSECTPQVVKSCDERTSVKNTKQSLIPVWIGHKNTQSSASNDTETNDHANQKFSCVTNNRNNISRIPIMLPIISEENLESLKFSTENLMDLKTENLDTEELSVVTPMDLTFAKEQEESHKGNISSESELCLSLLQNQNGKGSIECISRINTYSSENLQESDTEGLSFDKYSDSDSLIDVSMIENPRTLMEMSLRTDGRVVKMNPNKSLSGALMNINLSKTQRKTRSEDVTNKSSSESFLADVSSAIGDGNTPTQENYRLTSSDLISLAETMLFHSIVYDAVSFEEAAKVLLKINPSLVTDEYVTLKGHGKCKLHYDGVHVRNKSDETLQVSSAEHETERNVDDTMKSENESVSPQSSCMATPTISLTSTTYSEELMNIDIERKTEKTKINIGCITSDEAISELDVDITMLSAPDPSFHRLTPTQDAESPNMIHFKTEPAIVDSNHKIENGDVKAEYKQNENISNSVMVAFQKTPKSLAPKRTLSNTIFTDQNRSVDLDIKNQKKEKAEFLAAVENFFKEEITLTEPCFLSIPPSQEKANTNSSKLSILNEQIILKPSCELNEKYENDEVKTECKQLYENVINVAMVASEARANSTSPKFTLSSSICTDQNESTYLNGRTENGKEKTECKHLDEKLTYSVMVVTEAAAPKLTLSNFICINQDESADLDIKNENSEEKTEFITAVTEPLSLLPSSQASANRTSSKLSVSNEFCSEEVILKASCEVNGKNENGEVKAECKHANENITYSAMVASEKIGDSTAPKLTLSNIDKDERTDLFVKTENGEEKAEFLATVTEPLSLLAFFPAKANRTSSKLSVSNEFCSEEVILKASCESNNKNENGKEKVNFNHSKEINSKKEVVNTKSTTTKISCASQISSSSTDRKMMYNVPEMLIFQSDHNAKTQCEREIYGKHESISNQDVFPISTKKSCASQIELSFKDYISNDVFLEQSFLTGKTGLTHQQSKNAEEKISNKHKGISNQGVVSTKSAKLSCASQIESSSKDEMYDDVFLEQEMVIVEKDLQLKTENDKEKTYSDTSISKNEVVSKGKKVSCASQIKSSSKSSMSHDFCSDWEAGSVSDELDSKAEVDNDREVKYGCKNSNYDNFSKQNLSTPKSSSSVIKSKKSTSNLSVHDTVASQQSIVINGDLETEYDESALQEKEKCNFQKLTEEERTPNYSQIQSSKMGYRQRRGITEDKIVGDSHGDEFDTDDYSTYLRICLAAREGLLKEILKSLTKGYNVLQDKYSYLHKMDSDMNELGIIHSENDWKSLAKSSLKFIYWMTDFCDQGRRDIRNFEKMNVFKGESKVSRFFYKLNVDMAGDDVSGIFLPLPSLR